MAIVEDLRKTLTDPTPLYAVAGTVDLTAEKLREVPAFIEKLRDQAPERLATARATARATDPKAVQEKVTVRAKEVQAKFTEVVSSIDVKQLRDNAQDFALQQVGRAAEAAVKARETYDELAERGRGVVNNLRGEAAEQVEDVAVAIEPSEPKPHAPAPSSGQSKAANAKAVDGTASTAKPGESKNHAKPGAEKKAPVKRASAPKKNTPSKPGE